MVNLKFHSAVIFVKDIETSKKFYQEILDQMIDLDLGKNVALKSGISLWEIGPTHIIPERLGLESITTEKINRFELYFETEDIDQIVSKLDKSGVHLLHSLHEEPWGQRTVRFFDPDQHLIEVGETLEVFVKRFFQEGMTPEQVAAKTSVPLELVYQLIMD